MVDEGGGLTVAITGPTGAVGVALIRALERSDQVTKIVGMARSPFDPAEQGWKKTEYRRGDVLDKAAVADLVRDADVVVHLAFSILGNEDQARSINVEGSRNVFQAAFDAGVPRLVYTSSVAAYGYHDENPQPLTEDVPARGSEEHYYSAHKAEVEDMLEDMSKQAASDVYVFRPCIISGPDALILIENIPYVQLGERIPDPIRNLVGTIPLLRPVIPDPGVPFQLVHEDDVAQAFVAGVHGKGEPGPYNLAGNGTITISSLADALGWYSIPIPELAVDATAEVVARLPAKPPVFSWVESVRKPVLMKTDRAKKLLGWKPKYTSKATLKETVAAYRTEERF